MSLDDKNLNNKLKLTIDGMLYKDSIVTIDTIDGNKARVKDSMGKIYWVTEQHISASFL